MYIASPCPCLPQSHPSTSRPELRGRRTAQHAPGTLPARSPAQPWRCGLCRGFAQPGSCLQSMCARGTVPSELARFHPLLLPALCISAPSALTPSPLPVPVWLSAPAPGRAPLPPAPRHRTVPARVQLTGSCIAVQMAEPVPGAPQVNATAGDGAMGRERGFLSLPVRVLGTAPLLPLTHAAQPAATRPAAANKALQTKPQRVCSLCPWHGEGTWLWHSLG